MSYACKYCGESFEKALDLANHVRFEHKLAKKTEQTSKTISTKLPSTYDKSVPISDNIRSLKEERDALMLERQIERLSYQPQTQQQSQFSPKDMIDMFSKMQTQMLELVKMQKESSFTDELAKMAKVRELADAIVGGEIPTEGISDTELMKTLLEVVKSASAKREVPTSIPQQPIIQQAQDPNIIIPLKPKESESMELFDLLTEDAKKKIKSMDKETAFKLCRTFINVTKEEFDVIYEKCKT